MGSDMHFFATKEALMEILQGVSAEIEVKYVSDKRYDRPVGIEYNDLSLYPQFGISCSGDHQSESFFVVEQDKEIIFKESKQRDGTSKFYLGQDDNVDSIVLWPGGVYNDDSLISGHIGTISDSPISKKIFKAFQKNIKKRCKLKIGRYYIDDTLQSMKKYRLVTMTVKEPLEYDIQLPQE